MQAECPYGPDWRDAAAYAPLLDADRSLFAWEWLRRNAKYRAAAQSASMRLGALSPSAAAARFGLVAFEPPDLAVPDALPIWRSDSHPYVLFADTGREKLEEDAFDLNHIDRFTRILSAPDVEHLLLSDGRRSIRLDGATGTFRNGAVSLRYRIEGLVMARAPLLTLRRFLAFYDGGQFARSLHRPEARAGRWIAMLRAADALVAGADQREIAAELLRRSVQEPHWRVRQSSVRSQVQRLVRSARQMAAGGYLQFLR